MARKVFFSFHYNPDNWRVSQVRNMGMIEGNPAISANDWETVTRGGDSSIQRWIDAQLSGKECSIVLIGENTAGRKWVNYEIGKSWNAGKGLLGIYIHKLLDANQRQSARGTNPFLTFTMDRDQSKLSDIVKTYDPPFTQSTDVYAFIKNNIGQWVEDAIKIRNSY